MGWVLSLGEDGKCREQVENPFISFSVCRRYILKALLKIVSDSILIKGEFAKRLADASEVNLRRFSEDRALSLIHI